MMRPHEAFRATWRSASSAISNAAAWTSTANCRSIVSLETGRRLRPKRSDAAGLKVSASHPLALLTRISTGPNACSAWSNSMAIEAGSAKSASTASARPPAAVIAPVTAAASLARSRQ